MWISMIDEREKKDKNEKDESLALSKLWLTSFGKSISENERKKKKKFIRGKIMEKLKKRKQGEAFPRKNGKYNELFQDFGKESGSRDGTSGGK